MDKEQFSLELTENHTHIVEKKKAVVKTPSPWRYAGFFGSIGFGITIPLVAGIIIGSTLDVKYGTKPTITLIGLGIGFILSIISFFSTVYGFVKKG